MNTVYAVGLGPGSEEYMTRQAWQALDKCDIICGYTVYVDLVRDIFPDKEMFSTPMMKEIDRCRWAIEKAEEGFNVAMVCSGDSGVYGMATLLLEIAENYENIEIEVVPGVTAALSGGAVLGAPISHDFCVISLSDLLTPWELIEKRLDCAGQGDFAMAIYNPRSKKREDYLKKACEILLKSRTPETICGWVKNIGREGQLYEIMTLRELADEKYKDVDMFTTVFIGNSATRRSGNRMLTPRGYDRKCEL